MVRYRLSKKADYDLVNIYEYGILNFGLKQAQDYILGLHDRFEFLADGLVIGRSAAEFAPDLRRFEYGSHVIFYLPEDPNILVVRVLGDDMDFKRHI